MCVDASVFILIKKKQTRVTSKSLAMLRSKGKFC